MFEIDYSKCRLYPKEYIWLSIGICGEWIKDDYDPWGIFLSIFVIDFENQNADLKILKYNWGVDLYVKIKHAVAIGTCLQSFANKLLITHV